MTTMVSAFAAPAHTFGGTRSSVTRESSAPAGINLMPAIPNFGTLPPAGDATSEPVLPPLDCALLATNPTAINHLCAARLRLLHTLPGPDLGWTMWCAQCGSLREAYSGLVPTAAVGRGKRTAGGNKAEDDDEMSIACQLERELHRTLAEIESPSVKSSKPRKPRKAPRCMSCGYSFTRPTPNRPKMPSARAAARTRRQAALAAENSAQQTPERVEPSPPPADPIPSPSIPPMPPHPLARKPLAHLPNSDPSTPTYPKPPHAPPPASNGASTPPKTELSVTPAAKKRKIKKSGLAKLLAQNAGREAEKKGAAGNWGLG